MGSEEHPVWKVYDLHRTARLNSKYYGERLRVLEIQNLSIEIVLALSASTSVASWWVWKTDLGQTTWQTFGALTAVVAIVKPTLKLPDRIRRLEKAQTGYQALEYDLTKLEIQIANARAYTKAMQQAFLDAYSKVGQLIRERVETKEDKPLKLQMQEEVNRELPPDSFYVPGEDEPSP